ncbi:MAG: hypothetical protein ACT4PV_12545 [Planctomycetaceae bacterium]
MRAPLLLAALAAPLVAAEPQPLLESRGVSLESYEVLVDLARVDHETPRSLALSYAAFDTAAVQDVAARFARLFEKAHLDALRRTYAADLVEQQAKAYAETGPSARNVSFTILEEGAAGEGGKATVLLERRWEARDPGTGTYRLATLHVRLAMRREGRWWFLDTIAQAAPGGEFKTRDLGVPPLLSLAAPLAEQAPDLTSPQSALQTLSRDMARLQRLRAKGQNALYRHYFDLVRAFYGEAIAERARREQTAHPPPPPVTHEFGAPEPQKDGSVRIAVTALEEVAGERGQRSAVGQASFALASDALGDWRIVEERYRPDPEADFVPCRTTLGLFFR